MKKPRKWKLLELQEWPDSLFECGRYGEVGAGMIATLKEKIREAYKEGFKAGAKATRVQARKRVSPRSVRG